MYNTDVNRTVTVTRNSVIRPAVGVSPRWRYTSTTQTHLYDRKILQARK